jgi:WD40 repeat protein
VLNTIELITMGEEVEQPIITKTEPTQTFEDLENTNTVLALSVFSDGRHMVTGSTDRMLRLWDLKDRTVLKKIEGHRGWVRAVAASQPEDRQLIASTDNGEVIFWDRDTGESLTPAIKAHSTYIRSLDFSPDGKMLATGSKDHTVKLWNTETWQQQGNPINCYAEVYSVRYSPSGELLAIATNSDIQIRNPLGTRDCIAHFKDYMHTLYVGITLPLAWMPDGTRLLSGGCRLDPTIRAWDIFSGQQVGDPWKGHNHDINAIAVNSDGTLVASASTDHHVRLWQLWDRKTIAIFRHTSLVRCVTFSMDGKRILSGSDGKISEWTVPEDATCDVKACVYS